MKRKGGGEAGVVVSPLAALLVLLLLLCAEGVEGDTQRVLFIGNSYSFNLPGLYKAVTEATIPGRTVVVDSVLVGGAFLSTHATDSSVTQKLAAGDFDFLVLQEQSIVTTAPHQVEPLFEAARVAGATVVNYETWGRRYAFPGNDRQENVEHLFDYFQNRCINITIAPAGRTFGSIYEEDLQGSGVEPGGDSTSRFYRLYSSDGSHPSGLGLYLVSLSMFFAMNTDYPTGGAVGHVPAGVPVSDAEAVLRHVREQRLLYPPPNMRMQGWWELDRVPGGPPDYWRYHIHFEQQGFKACYSPFNASRQCDQTYNTSYSNGVFTVEGNGTQVVLDAVDPLNTVEWGGAPYKKKYKMLYEKCGEVAVTPAPHTYSPDTPAPPLPSSCEESWNHTHQGDITFLVSDNPPQYQTFFVSEPCSWWYDHYIYENMTDHEARTELAGLSMCAPCGPPACYPYCSSSAPETDGPPTPAPVTGTPISAAPITGTPTALPSSAPVTGTPTAPPTPAPVTGTPISAAPITGTPTALPSAAPVTGTPTSPITGAPTALPSSAPITGTPTAQLTLPPMTGTPTALPSLAPMTTTPTAQPSSAPVTGTPTTQPSPAPITGTPTAQPTLPPMTGTPTSLPSPAPITTTPTAQPSSAPVTGTPTAQPSSAPVTGTPTAQPSPAPITGTPTAQPTSAPITTTPTAQPSSAPVTGTPTALPSPAPITGTPTAQPTPAPITGTPTALPSHAPTTLTPTAQPSAGTPTGGPAVTWTPGNGGPVEEEEEKKKKKGGGKNWTWLIVLGVLGGVALCAGAGFLVVRSRQHAQLEQKLVQDLLSQGDVQELAQCEAGVVEEVNTQRPARGSVVRL
eukprot:TRINITY_DN4341_c0_g1_i1.p1 TRINITY_DN4341_c0_g1~~TRINITY_DN4341_c0_g1_i1.p1  ORF type:complete len:871 (+),score=209.76 TRINITY_DN4341_c0_g1_i1:69-2615(+)